jgi:hypothetical protein
MEEKKYSRIFIPTLQSWEIEEDLTKEEWLKLKKKVQDGFGEGIGLENLLDIIKKDPEMPDNFDFCELEFESDWDDEDD